MYRFTMLFLFAILFLFPQTALAIDFTISEDRVNPGDTITLTGQAEPSVWVSIKGIDSFGNIIYFDSIKNDNSGSFSRNIIIPHNTINYVVFIVGSGSETKKKEVIINDNDNSGGGGGSGGGAKPSTSNTPDTNNSTIISNEDGKKTQLFTVDLDKKEDILKAKENGCTSIVFNFQPDETVDYTSINITKDLVLMSRDLGITINTPQITIELNRDLINILANANQDLAITIGNYSHSSVQEQMSDISSIANSQILGDPLEIKTGIMGAAAVTIPLDLSSLNYSQNDLIQIINNTRIFVIHNDGEKEILTGNIVCDANNNPVALTFQVNRFSVFSVILLTDKEIRITVDNSEALINGESYFLDAKPYVDKSANRTMVPLRFIGEALGGKVNWDGDKNSVCMNYGENSIVLTIGEKEIYINSQEKIMDVPAQLISGRAFVPLRFIAENLGAKVEWDETTRTVTMKQGNGTTALMP